MCEILITLFQSYLNAAKMLPFFSETLVLSRAPQITGGFNNAGIAAAAVVPRPSTSSDVASGFRLVDVEHQIQQMATLLHHMPQVNGSLQAALLPDGGYPTEPAGSRSQLAAMLRTVPCSA